MEASLAPPRTVKSSPPTTTRRPSMRPVPITKLAGRMEASVSPSYFATPAGPPVARASSWRRLSSSTSGSQSISALMIPSARGFGEDRQMVVGRARVQDAQPRGRRVRRGQGPRQRPVDQAGQGGPPRRLYKGYAAPGPPPGPQGRRPRRAPGRARARAPALRRPHAARAAAPPLVSAAVSAAGRRPPDQARAPRARPAARVVIQRTSRATVSWRSGGRDDHRDDLRLAGDRRRAEPLSAAALHPHRHEALRDGGGH